MQNIMSKKDDFDFIDEEEIDKAIKNLIRDKGKEYDHGGKLKKKKYTADEIKKEEDVDSFIEKKKKRSDKMKLSSVGKDIKGDIREVFEKAAKKVVNSTELSTEEKLEKLDGILKKRFFNCFDKLKKLNSEEMKIKDEIVSSFIESERDILMLENLEISKPEKIYKDIIAYSRDVNDIYEKDSQLSEEDMVLLKEFSQDILKNVSPNRNEAIRTLSLTDYIDDNLSYLANHSINTAILSMICAIELSRLMKVRIENKKGYSIYDAQDYSKKIFNEEELIELGVLGLVHDIALKPILKGIKRDDKYPDIDKIKYNSHPIDSYYLISKMEHGIPKAINSIQHHHEDIVGTGFPKQINPRFMDKFARVLSFVVKYEEMAFGSPFTKHYGPSVAVYYLMKKERHKWDVDVVLSFLKATSLYPTGSYVELDNGEIGIVYKTNQEQIKRPVIKILIDKNNKKVIDERIMDLSKDSMVNIKKVIHPYHVRNMFNKYEKHFDMEEGFFEELGIKYK